MYVSHDHVSNYYTILYSVFCSAVINEALHPEDSVTSWTWQSGRSGNPQGSVQGAEEKKQNRVSGCPKTKSTIV